MWHTTHTHPHTHTHTPTHTHIHTHGEIKIVYIILTRKIYDEAVLGR